MLAKAKDLLQPVQVEIAEAFYEFILSFPELKNIVDASGTSIDELKRIQGDYFTSLLDGNYDLNYFCERLEVGWAHERIGLDIKWYVGAYRKYLSEVYNRLYNQLSGDTELLQRVFGALGKVVLLDVGLAIDAYNFSNKQEVLALDKRLHELIQGIDGFVWEYDVALCRFRYVSNKVEKLLGYTQQQWLEDPGLRQSIVHPDNQRETVEAFTKACQEGRSFAIEYRVFTVAGDTAWVSERVSAEKNALGRVALLRGLLLDVTERKRSEEQLAYLATYDELTGLPNRSLFVSHLKIALAEAKRNGRRLAILFLDLDGFKDINDSLGHEAGDQLIKGIAKTLSDRCLRKDDFVARLGGDEFCVILEDKQDDFRPETVAERCLAQLAKPILIESNCIYPRASIGITLFPDDAETSEALLQCADSAMYAAKTAGKHRYTFYNPKMTRLAEQRLSLENDLRKAVELGSFVLHYQPQIALLDGRMVAVEALIRWIDPVRGMVPPDEFIPVAERIGLIIPIGEWVLSTACKQFMVWRQAGVELDYIAVNISAMHFESKSLPATIEKVMRETAMPASAIELEITESVLQTNVGCSDCFKELQTLGIKIAIDDFGTGYSCLNSLTQLPLDCLKIDKSFIRDVLNDTNDAAIVATILAMSRIMKFKVIAEGVETLEQLHYLHAVGCDLAQGYYFSKPVPAERISELSVSGFLPL